MIKILIAAIASVLIFSCQQTKKQRHPSNNSDSTVVDTIALMNDPKNNLNVQTSSFSEIDSSGIIMFPLSMGEAGRDKGKSYYKEIPYSSYWNIIFYNSKNQTYHLLSEHKMIIRSIDLKQSSSDYSEASYTGNYIFYTVTVEDFNSDKILNQKDPDYLVVTDKEGNNFRQISPAGCHLKSWQLIKSSNWILMAVTKDTDNNKEFESEDEVCSFQIDIEKEKLPTEIFSTDFKKKLKVMFDKDWKRIK